MWSQTNGIYLENYFEQLTDQQYRTRSSSGIFSKTKDYENSADYTVSSYKGNTKPLEIKNCLNTDTFGKCRNHTSLYVLLNSRIDKKLLLLCKKRADEVVDTEYSGYKEIPAWFWLNKVFDQANYEKAGLGYSWRVVPWTDEYGEFIEFIAPTVSKVEEI